MVSVSAFDTFSRLPVSLMRASSCSDGSISHSGQRDITRYFKRSCGLHHSQENGDEAMMLSQDDGGVDQLPISQSRGGLLGTKIPTLDISRIQSQELPNTQGACTPSEQQHNFIVNYLDGPSVSHISTDALSPARSPIKGQKRHRPIHLGLDTDSESAMSQDGLSQGRSAFSQGEPSSSSKASARLRCRPPIPKNNIKNVRNELTRFGRSSPRQSAQEGADHNMVYQSAITNPSNVGVQHSRLYHDYAVEREIGHGNFSHVYRAVHRQCGKAYAIKKSRKALYGADMQTWLNEVTVLAAVEGHPNITTYYDSWMEPSVDGDHMHIKLELCSESLGLSVKAKQALHNNELWAVMCQIASALQHIHSIGYAHLDVKPDNIFRAVGPDSNRFKLGDFGLATLKDGSKGATEGDQRYMAPELLKNQHESLDKADMFALGATMYELASGCPLPTEGKRWHDIREGRLSMLPGATQQLQALIKKLLSSDPSLRPDATTVLGSCSRQKPMLMFQVSGAQ